MTKREEWLALAERCEKATGPDREIDWEIHVSIRYDGCGSYGNHPKYTASLDAITAPVEREIGGGWMIQRVGTSNPTRAVATVKPPGIVRFCGDSLTTALALCAAFCRAKAEVSHDQA